MNSNLGITPAKGFGGIDAAVESRLVGCREITHLSVIRIVYGM
jgi:hypothetical protein